MPNLSPNLPPAQIAPQQTPDPLERANAAMAQAGIRLVQPQRNILSSLIEQNLREMQEQEDKPVFSGFMRDVANTAVGGAKEIWRAMLSVGPGGTRPYVPEYLDTRTPAEILLTQDFERTQAAGLERLENETNPQPINLATTYATRGLVQGADFGLRNLPVIGDFFHAHLGPVGQELEVASNNAMRLNLNAMNSKLGQTALVELPALGAGLGGTLATGYATLKPWFAVGNVMLTGRARLRAAATFADGLRDIARSSSALHTSFVSDVAGSMVFGAVTGERGFISGVTEGPVEASFGTRVGEMAVDPRDPWWKQGLAQTVNRSEAAVAMGADTFVLSALFMTGFGAMGHMGTYATAKMKEIRSSLLGGPPISADKIMAMRQQQILTEPGMRRFAVLRTPEEGEIYVDLLMADELISRSPGARRILAEQAAIEPVLSYHSHLAALAKAVDEIHLSGEATHGILRGVEDPYRMLREIYEPQGAGPQKLTVSLVEEIPLGTGSTQRRFHFRTADHVGRTSDLLADFDPATGHLEVDVFDLAGRGELGTKAVLDAGGDMVRALDELGINAQTVGGYRSSGARVGPARANEGALDLRMDIPAERLRNRRFEPSPSLSEEVRSFRRGGEMRPIVHRADELPETAIFGYTEGWTGDPLTQHVRSVDRNVPVFLKNRPKAPAVERGAVEEVIVVPGKPWEFDSWNHVMEKYGSVDDMIRAARKNNVDVVNVNNTGAEGGMQHIILDPAAIKSAKPVTPDALGRQPSADADAILAELGEEPLEVALKRRLPGYKFETPIRREDGTYDLIFAPEGAPNLKPAQLKALKETGFFEGQRVMYGGKTWEVVRRLGKGGRGSRIEIIDPTTKVKKAVAVSSVSEYPSAIVPMEVDDALFRDFVEYFDDKLRLVGNRQIDEPTLRDIAMASDDPARMNRDYADQGLNAVIHPHEMVAQLDVADALAARVKEIDAQLSQIGPDINQAAQIQTLVRERNALQAQVQESARRAQAEGRLTESIDLDNAFVDFPDELDYGTIAFHDWARSRGLELSSGEAQALKHTFYRRMNEEAFERLPNSLKTEFRRIQEELVDAMEKLPQSLDTVAAQAGYEVLRLKNNTLALRRPGSFNYEGLFASEEAAQAALKRSLRYGGIPNMTPQYNYLNVSLPSGPGTLPVAGVNVSDMHFLFADEAAPYLTRNEIWNQGKWLSGKANWLARFEDASGIPMWTEFVEPLFAAGVRATNVELPFKQRFVAAFQGIGVGSKPLSLDERLGIRDFIRTIESHTVYVDKDQVVQRAKDFGLNSRQIRALQGMREVMDEMFQIGTRLYGWTPNDYIYTYLTKLLPQEQAFVRGDITPDVSRRYRGLVPDDMDVFLSKYTRNEARMLPVEEEDPLVIGMKYIHTFFHEAYVREPFERLGQFLNAKLKDLPPEQANRIIQGMQPTVRRQLERSAGGSILNAEAIPPQIREPLKEMMEYIRGYPTEANDLTVRIIRKVGSVLGMKLDERAASEIVNSLLLGTYGTLLAFRPKPVVRNMFQTIGNLASRTSFAAVEIGLQRATDPAAFARAVDDGIIDLTARGLPFGQNITTQALEAAPIETKGTWGWFWGGMLKANVLDGTVARTWRGLSEKGLVGIGRTDMFTRVAAAETADVFVRPWATKYVDGAIDADKLVEKALPYWETGIRNHFVELIDTKGLEAGMSYIRRETSTIANYLYNKTAQPTFMQSPTGRAFFQFGTWPIWRKDLMVRSIRNARGFDEKFRYVAVESMIHGALILAGLQLGVNMAPWIANESILTYAGGPITQFAVDFHNALSQNDYSSRAESIRRMAANQALTMAPVGRLFFEDAINSIKYAKDDPRYAFYNMFIGRPNDSPKTYAEQMIGLMQIHQQELDAMRQDVQQATGGGELVEPTPEQFAPSRPIQTRIQLPQ